MDKFYAHDTDEEREREMGQGVGDGDGARDNGKEGRDVEGGEMSRCGKVHRHTD